MIIRQNWEAGLVALLAEGVDRNREYVGAEAFNTFVALLAEGVDRNFFVHCHLHGLHVALLAEGVDRNLIAKDLFVPFVARRPPRGGRG